MNELNAGEVITIEDGALSAAKYLGSRGRPEYELEFPAIDGVFWSHAGEAWARLVIDDDTARRLAGLINAHMGDTNE